MKRPALRHLQNRAGLWSIGPRGRRRIPLPRFAKTDAPVPTSNGHKALCHRSRTWTRSIGPRGRRRIPLPRSVRVGAPMTTDNGHKALCYRGTWGASP